MRHLQYAKLQAVISIHPANAFPLSKVHTQPGSLWIKCKCTNCVTKDPLIELCHYHLESSEKAFLREPQLVPNGNTICAWFNHCSKEDYFRECAKMVP